MTSASTWLERWSKLAADQGTRAMDALRDGVAEAIVALGSGYLAQPANQALRARLQSGELSTQAYYQQHRYRAVFDTNVFVSAALSKSLTSPTRELLARWEQDEFTRLTCEDLVAELVEKLLAHQIPPGSIARLVDSHSRARHANIYANSIAIW